MVDIPARFYVKALFERATILGWLDFKHSFCRDQHARSFNNEPICLHLHCCWSFTMWWDLSVAFFAMSWLKDAVTFWRQGDFQLQQDFKEIEYACTQLTRINSQDSPELHVHSPRKIEGNELTIIDILACSVSRVSFRIFVKGEVKVITAELRGGGEDYSSYLMNHVCDNMHPRNLLEI